MDGRIFSTWSNHVNGDVGQDTLFYYHQKDDYLWGHYEGGRIIAGVLIGKVLKASRLQFTYSHYDLEGNYKTGRCRTEVVLGNDGLIELRERWQWTTGDLSSGTSVLIEKKY